MEKSKVSQSTMTDSANRRFVMALSTLSAKTWVVTLNETVQELIDAETITPTTELVDDVAATMTAVKDKIVAICTPAPVIP
jgi:hypothetical protein